MSRDYNWYLSGLSMSMEIFEKKVNEFINKGLIMSSPTCFIISELRLYSVSIDFDYQYFQIQCWESNKEVVQYMERKKYLNEIWQNKEKEFAIEEILDTLQSDVFNRIVQYGYFVRWIKDFETAEIMNMLGLRDTIAELLPNLSQNRLKEAYQNELIFSDEILKSEYVIDPHALDSFTIEYRSKRFVPKSYWWWYMDELKLVNDK